jgi:FkbM family methyltransferase
VTSATALTMVDGVRVVVPDSLNLITSYVLREQQDWFEDEIKFLRRLLRPGQRVIDIGANYGVYALSMARTVGPEGRVWAFEPASRTAQLLAQGIAVNGFSQVVLDRSALSSVRGTAQLSLNENSELNALVHRGTSPSASETVQVTTLDECMERHAWRDIAFMKIDAEGEEANILKGGERFFAELSPLIQYEIKAGMELHDELVQQFAALGYDSYRLVPGLDLLIPFDLGAKKDDYLLNLFCCKRQRAEALAADGFLLNFADRDVADATERSSVVPATIRDRSVYDWRHGIAKLPYGLQLADRWNRSTAAAQSTEVEEALSLYAVSLDRSLPATDRFVALEACLGLLKSICGRQPSHLRLASLARAARDYGARSIAVNALRQLADDIMRSNRVDPSEPFLAPGERFDGVAPGASIGNWVLAAVLEVFERLSAFSSFYTGSAALQRLQTIRELGYYDAEMERRLHLVQARNGLAGR